MPTRSSDSEFQPSPPSTRLNRGRVRGRLAIITPDTNTGTKSNMCVAPATNGDRATGNVTASQPDSTRKGMKVSPTIS